MVLDICQAHNKCLLLIELLSCLVNRGWRLKKIKIYSEIKFIFEDMRFKWRRRREKLPGGIQHFILLSNYRIIVLNWCLCMLLWKLISQKMQSKCN